MEPTEQGEVKAVSIIGSLAGSQVAAPVFSTQPAEIEILPVIYEIIRSVEKDPVDNTAKQKESHDCSQKILELHRRLELARGTIRLLPGINYSKEEQLRRLESLHKQLTLKQQLIKKYKNVQF
ncbi:mediator of RNA polymerase II transcription subunit 9 [Toxorhynchites rutilus septentrionalis]|uniref:mediator of RNA polymerase II transcription subunit 9 n=1 Tax=Toxorhynchites rutilus septentrionalis TaxID=329112 RepID=UPI0024785F82|nr:mediator of RNA polymerase II transcription subunit 9 [Toxorhynchites rutilus septentrionalis]